MKTIGIGIIGTGVNQDRTINVERPETDHRRTAARQDDFDADGVVEFIDPVVGSLDVE